MKSFLDNCFWVLFWFCVTIIVINSYKFTYNLGVKDTMYKIQEQIIEKLIDRNDIVVKNSKLVG